MVRTWAPRGQTPILRHPGGWKKLSAAAGVTRRGFYFRLYPGSIKAPQLTHFLGHLKRQIPGKILLVWDRLGVHRSKALRAWLQRQGGRFLVEELPAYAPELNPVESQHRGQRLCADGRGTALAGSSGTAPGPTSQDHPRGRLLETSRSALLNSLYYAIVSRL